MELMASVKTSKILLETVNTFCLIQNSFKNIKNTIEEQEHNMGGCFKQNLINEWDLFNRLLTRKCSIVAVGLLNAGKSTFVNEFLRQLNNKEKTISLPTHQNACTNRITRLIYNKEPVLWKINNETKQRSDPTHFSGFEAPKDEIKKNESEKDEEFYKYITEIGFPHPMFEKGSQIVDCPGVSDTEQITLYFQKNLDPDDCLIILYLMNDVKIPQDIENIKAIKAKVPDAKWIFLATKFDVQKRNLSMDEEEDDDESPEQTEKRLLDPKFGIMVNNLIKENVIENKDQLLRISSDKWFKAKSSEDMLESYCELIKRIVEELKKESNNMMKSVGLELLSYLQNRQRTMWKKLSKHLDQLFKSETLKYRTNEYEKLKSFLHGICFSNSETVLFKPETSMNFKLKELNSNYQGKVKYSDRTVIDTIRFTKEKIKIKELNVPAKFFNTFAEHAEKYCTKATEVYVNEFQTFWDQHLHTSTFTNNYHNCVTKLSISPIEVSNLLENVQPKYFKTKFCYKDDVYKEFSTVCFHTMFSYCINLSKSISEIFHTEGQQYIGPRGQKLLNDYFDIIESDLMKQVKTFTKQSFTNIEKTLLHPFENYFIDSNKAVDTVKNKKDELHIHQRSICTTLFELQSELWKYQEALSENSDANISSVSHTIELQLEELKEIGNQHGDTIFRLFAKSITIGYQLQNKIKNNHSEGAKNFIEMHKWNYCKRESSETIILFQEATGVTLLEHIAKHNPPLHIRYKYALDVLNSLQIIHDCNYMFNDLRPEAVFISEDEQHIKINLFHCEAPFSPYKYNKRPPFHVHPEFHATYPQGCLVYDFFAFASFLWLILTTEDEISYPDMYKDCNSSEDILNLRKDFTKRFPERIYISREIDADLYRVMVDSWRCDRSCLSTQITNIKTEFLKILKTN